MRACAITRVDRPNDQTQICPLPPPIHNPIPRIVAVTCSSMDRIWGSSESHGSVQFQIFGQGYG